MSNASQRPRQPKAKNTFTTRSGKNIKLNQSLTDRIRAGREAKAQRKAAYLSSLPKERWKRVLYRFHWKRLYQYWFSRDGAVMALKITGVGFVVVFLLIVGLFAYFRKDLPKIQDLNSGDSGGSIAYYYSDGKTLMFQDFTAFKRTPVSSINDISPYMREATIAIEDKDFYHEGAFNVKGITRAAINNVTGGSTQGGSTITQQLVKLNENWTSDHTVSRKVKELILAVELEREFSKDDILTAYLNTAPYSGRDAGVEAAAQDLFHTDAKNLTLEQAALLAAIPKNPSYLSPYASPVWNPSVTSNLFDEKGLLAREQYILDLMVKQHYITQAQADDAKKKDILGEVQQLPASHYTNIQAPYAVMEAKAQLENKLTKSALRVGGWKVVTTIDKDLQYLAQTTLDNNANSLKHDKADNAAFVAEDNSTGQVVALVGGMNFDTQQVNFASTAPISPGSSVKPYSYATLINDNNNVGAGSALSNTLGALPGYPCGNKATPEADPNNPSPCLFNDIRGMHDGNVTLRYALGSSLNIPAVKAFTSTDPKDTTTAASGDSWRRQSINHTMSAINAMMDTPDGSGYKCYDPAKLEAEGRTILTAQLTDRTQCGAAAGIGNEAYTTLADHVNGLATLARMGQTIPQTIILKVTNASGKVLISYKQPKGKQVIQPDAAYIVNDMAADPGASYLAVYGGSCSTTNCTGYRFHRYKGWENAIKTGTNEDLDGLMMSWNTKFTAGVWIGNYDRHPYGGTPEKVTDPIMKAWMQGAIDSLGNSKPVNWTKPNDIKTLPAYHSIVPFHGEATPPNTDLFPSWYVAKSGGNDSADDKVSGKLATSCTPPLAKSTDGILASQWNVDIYMGGSPSSNQTTSNSSQPTDDVHACSDTWPTVNITAINNVATGGSSTPTCPPTPTCSIRVHVEQGTHALTDPTYPDYPGTITLTINGQAVNSQEIDESGDYVLTFTPPADGSGSIQITAQITDSVLYTGTDTQTFTMSGSGHTSFAPTTSGPGPGKGPGKKQLALVR
ncbi:MAG TPA: transglycosylase domain-containing protein [Candidatus Saccharimonadales bacterium]|nr:transglycosylase domain-containing protein [Candidatus Saccharimonadales bacterium]